MMVVSQVGVWAMIIVRECVWVVPIDHEGV